MPVAVPLEYPFAENGLSSKMYWQNQQSSTLDRKLEYELDDGTPWNGMERIIGLCGSWQRGWQCPPAPPVTHAAGLRQATRSVRSKKDF
jgi:hypothetical protein